MAAKKYPLIQETWWGCVLGESCGVMAFLDLKRKEAITLCEQTYGKPWAELKEEGWRVVKLRVEEQPLRKS